MFGFSLIDIIAGIPGLIMALVVHEYAHARVAVAMGDYAESHRTAYAQSGIAY